MTSLVAGIFVASAVVTVMRWLQVHDRRLLPLAGFFLMMAAASLLDEEEGVGGEEGRGIEQVGVQLRRAIEQDVAARAHAGATSTRTS